MIEPYLHIPRSYSAHHLLCFSTSGSVSAWGTHPGIKLPYKHMRPLFASLLPYPCVPSRPLTEFTWARPFLRRFSCSRRL